MNKLIAVAFLLASIVPCGAAALCGVGPSCSATASTAWNRTTVAFGSPACENNCTQRWIFCQRACSSAPNFGNDSNYYNRKSNCMNNCQNQYGSCKASCF